MRRVVLLVLLVGSVCPAWSQTFKGCACGKNPPGRPAARSMKPYAQEPEDMQPFSKFTEPYYQHYVDLVEYNGAARDIPMPKDVTEVRIGFIGPLENHPDAALGKRMLNGAQMAVDEANAAGGYGGKPFKLMLHNDSAIWGASSNEVVKMVYDDQDWAIFGSISGDTTHIALRASLRAEIPIVNSASTDPTIVETIIPWYFSVLQDDRTQGYTLARHIYTDLGMKRVAILRVNDRYGRFGVGKFRDASRRLGHPVVIEQKFFPYDTDFTRQLKVHQRVARGRHRALDGRAAGGDDPEADAGTWDEAAGVRQPSHAGRSIGGAGRRRRRKGSRRCIRMTRTAAIRHGWRSRHAMKPSTTRSPTTSPPWHTTRCRFCCRPSARLD